MEGSNRNMERRGFELRSSDRVSDTTKRSDPEYVDTEANRPKHGSPSASLRGGGIVPVFSATGERIASLTKKKESGLEMLVRLSKDLAETALELHNRKERSDFVLVQPLLCNSIPHDCAYYYHLNFLAKPRDSPTVYLFFAELFWAHELSHCCILPTDDMSSVGFSNGCGICDPNHAFQIYHPLAGYKAGSYPYDENNDYVWSSDDSE